MTAKRKPYQTYPEAFKLEALRLLEESDRPVSEVARQLGVRRNHPVELGRHPYSAVRDRPSRPV